MNKSTLSVAILASLMVTACSSGGGGQSSPDNPSTSNTNKTDVVKSQKPKVEAPNVESPKIEAPKVEAPKVEVPKVEAPKVDVPKAEVPEMVAKTGAFYSFKGLQYSHQNLSDASNLDFIIIDGHKMKVSDGMTEDGVWSHFGRSMSCCYDLKQSRFGYISIGDYSGFVFYNGTPTQDMPVSGQAAYAGEFFLDGKVKDENAPSALFGRATFEADFAHKTLTGKLFNEPLSPIEIQAKIEGSRFTGTANAKEFYNPAELEGQFYNENASELGGIFSDKQKLMGAFGAVKK